MDDVAIRLLEMGLTPGVEFELLGIALPWEIRSKSRFEDIA